MFMATGAHARGGAPWSCGVRSQRRLFPHMCAHRTAQHVLWPRWGCAIIVKVLLGTLGEEHAQESLWVPGTNLGLSMGGGSAWTLGGSSEP